MWQLRAPGGLQEDPVVQVLIKPLLVRLLLMSHRPKLLAWPSPESMEEETIKRQKYSRRSSLGTTNGTVRQRQGRHGFPGGEARSHHRTVLCGSS